MGNMFSAFKLRFWVSISLVFIIPFLAPAIVDSYNAQSHSSSQSVMDNQPLSAMVRLLENPATIAWIRQFGSPSLDTASSITLDSSGNIYVAGYAFGVLPGQTSYGGEDAFLRKYDTSGNEVWTRQFGTVEHDTVFSVATATMGFIYVAGYTLGVLPGQISRGNEDAFIIKYDSAGNVVWTRQFGTSLNDRVVAVDADTAGNIYVAGITQGALPGEINVGNWDTYVRKYDTSGNEVWTRQFGSPVDDLGAGLVLDDSNNIYIGGHTYGSLLGQSSSGRADSFIVKYDTAGNLVL